MFRYLLLCTLVLHVACGGKADRFQFDEQAGSLSGGRKDCWQDGNKPRLLDVMQNVMTRSLEPDLVRDNFIQTFGCAYEEVEVEVNAVQAVHRAILQSLRNRNVEVRDDLLALLYSTPPRPDNLVRDYAIYVNLKDSNGDLKVASYEVKILDLELISTVESPVAIWTRIATRFRHREDHYRALPLSMEKSDFVKVIEKAQNVLQLAERGRMDDILQLFGDSAQAQPTDGRLQLSSLAFADQFQLVDEYNPSRRYPAVFLGKGIALGMTPKNGAVVFKFGEERLYGLRIDMQNFKRVTDKFVEYNYQAPETILRCLFLKASARKPASLPGSR